MGKCKTKDRLLASATIMFADKGFFNTSINDICQDAQANISAVNYHFRDKKGLYEAVFIETITIHQLKLEEIFTKNLNISPEEVVKQYIRYHLQIALMDTEHIVFNKLRLRHMVDAENIGMSESLQEKIKELSGFVHKMLKLFLGEDAPSDVLNLLQYTLVSQCLMPGINPYFKNYFVAASGSPKKALDVFTEHIFNGFINAVKHYKVNHKF